MIKKEIFNTFLIYKKDGLSFYYFFNNFPIYFPSYPLPFSNIYIGRFSSSFSQKEIEKGFASLLTTRAIK